MKAILRYETGSKLQISASIPDHIKVGDTFVSKERWGDKEFAYEYMYLGTEYGIPLLRHA